MLGGQWNIQCSKITLAGLSGNCGYMEFPSNDSRRVCISATRLDAQAVYNFTAFWSGRGAWAFGFVEVVKGQPGEPSIHIQ